MRVLRATFAFLLVSLPAFFSFQYAPFCTENNGTRWTQGPFEFWCHKNPGEIAGSSVLTGCVENYPLDGYTERCSRTKDGIELFYDSCLNDTTAGFSRCHYPLTMASNLLIACVPGSNLSVGYEWQWDTVKRGIYSHGYGSFRVCCTIGQQYIKSEVVGCIDEKGELLMNGAEWIEGRGSYPDSSFVKSCLVDSRGGRIYTSLCVQPTDPAEFHLNNTFWPSSDQSQLLTCRISGEGTEKSDVHVLPLRLKQGEIISKDLHWIVNQNRQIVACLTSTGERKEVDEEWGEGDQLKKCVIVQDGTVAQIQTVVCGSGSCTNKTTRKDDPLPVVQVLEVRSREIKNDTDQNDSSNRQFASDWITCLLILLSTLLIC